MTGKEFLAVWGGVFAFTATVVGICAGLTALFPGTLGVALALVAVFGPVAVGSWFVMRR